MDGAMSKAPLGGEKNRAQPDRSGQGRNETQRADGSVRNPRRTRSRGSEPRHLEIDAVDRPQPLRPTPRGLCLDKGYDYTEVRDLLREFSFTEHIRCRGEEAKAIKKAAGFKARRWVVERTHSWMNRFRRILVRWEKRADTYVAMLHFACAIITWKSCGVLG